MKFTGSYLITLALTLSLTLAITLTLAVYNIGHRKLHTSLFPNFGGTCPLPTPTHVSFAYAAGYFCDGAPRRVTMERD